MKLTTILILTALAFGHAHYMAYAEDKCAELGNTPQQCALLAQQNLEQDKQKWLIQKQVYFTQS